MSNHRKRRRWLVPILLCAASAACVGNYDPEPIVQATADSIAKDSRYGIRQALVRDGTNQPVPGLFYYLNSPLGSTSVVFDAAGAAVTRIGYFPDGAVDPAATSGDYIATHTFGQKEYDRDLDLYYNLFRYYDAETARFTTPDAVKDSSDFLVHNIYAYTRNNPVNYIDPTGFWAMKADGQKGYKPQKTPTYRAPRPANRVRTRGFNDGVDGGRRPAKAAIKRPDNRTKTDRYNRGPDGGERVPIKRTVVVPHRDFLPADGVRGYEASAYSYLDRSQFDKVVTMGMPSMKTPAKVHMALGYASYFPIIGSASASIDAGLYLLIDGDFGAAGMGALGLVPGGRLLGKTAAEGGKRVMRVIEPGKPEFQLRQGEQGLSVFDADRVTPENTLPYFRDGSQVRFKSVDEIRSCGLTVICTPGHPDLPQHLQDAHMEIRPGENMTRNQFKQALKQLNPQ